MALRFVSGILEQQISNYQTRILSSATNLKRIHQTQPYSSDSSAYAGDGKTVVRVLNAEESPLNLVNTYSAKGFRLNNQLFISGSILLFPTNVFAWNVKRGKDINLESLLLFDLIVPKVKIVIIGYGQKGEPYDASLPMRLKKKGISCEMLPTPNAVTTYNYLVNDSVHAAGAFIPVKDELDKSHRDEVATFGYDRMFGGLEGLPKVTARNREPMGYEKERHAITNQSEDINKDSPNPSEGPLGHLM